MKISLQWQRLTLSIITALTLAACGGGITGTGEGIIMGTTGIDAGGMGTGIEASPNDSASDSGISRNYTPNILPGIAANSFAVSRSENSTQSTTVTEQLHQQLQAYQQVTDSLSVELLDLDVELSSNFSPCEASGICTTIPANATDNSVVFTNLSLTRGTPGYFDSELSYSRADGTDVMVKWNHDSELIYYFVYSSNAVTYSFTDRSQSMTTLRHYSITDNTLIQATIKNDATTLFTEADLGNWYVRAVDRGNSSDLYAKGLNDLLDRRETTSADDNTVSVETCESDSCIWQPGSTDNGGDSSLDSPSDFSQTISASVDQSLPTEPQRFVIAQNAGTASPTLSSILCGGVNFSNNQRVFCWQPLPLNNPDTRVFEETTGNGVPFYLPVDNP